MVRTILAKLKAYWKGKPMSFKPGDVCVVVHTIPSINGMVVTLQEQLNQEQLCNIFRAHGVANPVISEAPPYWKVDEMFRWTSKDDANSFNDVPYIAEKYLRKMDDGNSKSSWDECIWKPKDLVLVKEN